MKDEMKNEKNWKTILNNYQLMKDAHSENDAQNWHILGFDLELEGPHELTFAYILDQQINLPDPLQKHIFSISYNYKLKSKKKAL